MNSEPDKSGGDPNASPDNSPRENQSGDAIHRLHPAAMLIGALKTIRRWVGALVIPSIAFLASQGFSVQTIVLVFTGMAVVAALAAVWGFLAWRATTYEVSGGAFHLRQGVIQKSERTIPLDHVQSVDTVQGIIQRVFGVVEVRVETAGGGTDEPDASLSALGRGAAAALRREIEGSRRGSSPATEEGMSGPVVVRRLATRDLLIAGATSGQIGVALSLVAVISQVFDDLLSEEFVERVVTSFTPHSITALLLLVAAAGLFAWLLAIGGTVLAHAGFTLSRDGDYLYIRRGLLERREATIPLSRIQAVRVVEGFLRQPFGLATLRVESAGYGENAGVSTILFPLLPRRKVDGFLRAAVPEFAGEPLLKHLPRRALRRYVFRAVLATIPLVAVVSFIAVFGVYAGFTVPGCGAARCGAEDIAPLALEVPAVLSLAVLLVLASLYGWLQYRDAGWAISEDRLVARSRLLARTTTVAPRRRLQSRSVVSSPFQRRLRLATLQARVASGGGGAEVRIVDLDALAAGQLADSLGPGTAS